MTARSYFTSDQLKQLDTLHECSNALRDLKLLRDFLLAEGGSDMIVLSRQVVKSHGYAISHTYNLRLSELRPALQSVEMNLRRTLQEGGYDISSLPIFSQVTKQSGG